MARERSRQQRESFRVLVVEADPHVRRLLRRVLEQDGRFTPIDEASDVVSALACPPGYRAVLIDLALAGLDGQGVIAALHERTPSPAVLVLSLTGVPYLRYAATVEGADDFLVRPVELPEFGDRIARAAAWRALKSPA